MEKIVPPPIMISQQYALQYDALIVLHLLMDLLLNPYNRKNLSLLFN